MTVDTPTPAPRITFGIIALERIPALEKLVSRLLEITADDPARSAEVVIGLESPGVDELRESATDGGRVRWLEVPAKRGIAYNRNRVLDAAAGEILVWADDDCMPEAGWLDGLLAALEDPTIDAAAGAIRVPPAGFVGDSISALGFPAGGSAGYATMFTVHADGTTEHLPGGNSAARTDLFREMGGFDESLTQGGEDSEFSHRLRAANKRIAFVPSSVLDHPARTSLIGFAKWSVRRGRAKRQFARRVAIGGYVGSRLGSYGAILKRNATDLKIVLIAPLLVANLLLQAIGYAAETIRPTSWWATRP